MSQAKVFAGQRIRRVRVAKGISQTAMAAELGISPSYLNLIERNQRPLTVQLLVRLSSVYGVDAGELTGDGDATLSGLKEAFADPLLSGELTGEGELLEFAEATPNAAAALLKLYRAYREQAVRLSDLAQLLAKEGRASVLSGARFPPEEVRDVLERRPSHFGPIESAATAFLESLGSGDDLAASLKTWLGRQHAITVRSLPVSVMPNWRRRYDRHSRRLLLSERLTPFDQLREIAIEASLLRMEEPIDEVVAGLALSSDEARRLARFEIARYAAHALMMPLEPFRQAARASRYDLDVLRSRFRVSFEQAANRLTSLPKGDCVPFFLMEVDSAGNPIRRAGAMGFPHARFGGACPKLAVHTAFAQPGQIIVEAVETPDDERFLTLARTIEGPQGTFGERPRRTAVLLGCEERYRNDVVYSDALPPFHRDNAKTITIGPVCRLCPRTGCLSRAQPPVTRPLGLDEMVTGLSAFDFQ